MYSNHKYVLLNNWIIIGMYILGYPSGPQPIRPHPPQMSNLPPKIDHLRISNPQNPSKSSTRCAFFPEVRCGRVLPAVTLHAAEAHEPTPEGRAVRGNVHCEVLEELGILGSVGSVTGRCGILRRSVGDVTFLCREANEK